MQSQSSLPSFTRQITAISTKTYTATVTDAAPTTGVTGCTANDQLTLTVIPPAPVNLVATATSSTQVQLTWFMPGFAESYEVQRRSAAGSFITVSAPLATNTTSTVAADTAYLYRVRAIEAGTPSAWSVVDVASTYTVGTDLVPQVSIISASHITKLRSAVNALRALASLSATSFTDPDLTTTPVPMKALHITERRNALNAARQSLGLSALGYTTPSLTAGNVCMASHINDLRGGVR